MVAVIAAAVAIVLFSVPFLCVVVAEGLVALGLPRWLSYLIVWVLFLLVAGALALIGRSQLRKIRPPERTMKTAKDTATWARHPTSPTSPTSPTAPTAPTTPTTPTP